MEREVLNRKSNGWQHKSKGLALRNINKSHPRRSVRMSASVGADDVCILKKVA